jgi:hypothetical protein
VYEEDSPSKLPEGKFYEGHCVLTFHMALPMMEFRSGGTSKEPSIVPEPKKILMGELNLEGERGGAR